MGTRVGSREAQYPGRPGAQGGKLQEQTHTVHSEEGSEDSKEGATLSFRPILNSPP